jgi:zinc D-Ala-D-Ala dipeptidase
MGTNTNTNTNTATSTTTTATAPPPDPTTTTTTLVPAAHPAPPPPLVDVLGAEPTIVVALNKVSDANVTGRALPGYEANRAFLQPEAAAALGEVQRALRPMALGLKVYDAYRPLRATQALVEWARSQGRADLVGPYIAARSFHNSGQAVDLTLVSLPSGGEVDMGTSYETFTPDAHTANATGIPAQNRSILVNAMESAGFENYEGEWWHFNYFVSGAEPLDEPIR